MKKRCLIICWLLSVVFQLNAQENTITPKNLKNIDAAWENALLHNDIDFLNDRLSPKFIWIHNHLSQIDDKNSVIAAAKKNMKLKKQKTVARIQENVTAIITQNTGVVTGNTIVERNGKKTTYNFMRTYFLKNKKIILLSNHTMEIPKTK